MPADIQTLYAAPERRPSLHRSPMGRSRHIPIHDYPVHFSGTGSEYFRIWIVNLLLVIVTFGIYWPWARRRKLQYLYHCTWVDGHAFDFHGNPRSMLRGSTILISGCKPITLCIRFAIFFFKAIILFISSE